jgi:hypothetical protein
MNTVRVLPPQMAHISTDIATDITTRPNGFPVAFLPENRTSSYL